MEKYEIREIMSGIDNGTLWVTVGFSSQLEELDVLHIVCAEEIDDQDIEFGMDGIYLERFDQAYSCYKGAIEILVKHDHISISLNEKGMKALDLSDNVKYTIPESLNGIDDAKAILSKMASFSWGKAIKIA